MSIFLAIFYLRLTFQKLLTDWFRRANRLHGDLVNRDSAYLDEDIHGYRPFHSHLNRDRSAEM